MAQRLYMSGNPPRLITSKPGYNADTGLPDIYKTFDSDWFNGAGIRWIFRIDLNSIASKTVIFPYALDHIPRYGWMWKGYHGGGASLPSMPAVEWDGILPDGGAYWSTSWQRHPSGWSAPSSSQYVKCYNDRFVLSNTGSVPNGFGTLVVYQS